MGRCLVILNVCLVLIFSSCDDRKVVSVTSVGDLENLIRDGDMSTHAHLKDFENQSDFYGIGIVTNNEGYINIIGGKSYTSYVDSDKNIAIDSSFNADATLLLYSRVKNWKTYDIPSDVTTWKQLEQFISNQAVKYNVSRTKAFPFLLKGTVVSLKYQVLDWRPNIKEITYKKLLTFGATGVLNNEYVEAIGFFSKEPKDIFTHQETVLNLHFVNHNHSVAGRIDDLELDGRVKLYLPEDSK